jgi:hypothetical protein
MENIIAVILIIMMIIIDNNNGIDKIEHFQQASPKRGQCNIRGKKTQIIYNKEKEEEKEEKIQKKKKLCTIEYFLPQKNIWVFNKNEISSRFWKNFKSRRISQKKSGIEYLCLESIKKNLSSSFKINIINLDNLNKFIPEKIEFLNKCKDFKTFINLVKYYILYKFGGLWIPLDTIILRNINFNPTNNNKLIVFKENNPNITNNKGFSDDIIYCLKNNNIVQEMIKIIENQLKTFQNEINFNNYINKYFNEIIFKENNFLYKNLSVQKLSNGNYISVGDLFSINNLYIENLENKVFFSVEIDKINKYTEYNFLERLSKRQILRSNLYLAFILKYALKL